MSLTLRPIKPTALRVLQTKCRGCNTNLGAIALLERRHTDVIQKYETRNENSDEQVPTKFGMQHGHNMVSALTKQYDSGSSRYRALRTHMVPTVMQYKRIDKHTSSNKDLGNSPNYPSLQQLYWFVNGENKYKLNALSGQELDMMFEIPECDTQVPAVNCKSMDENKTQACPYGGNILLEMTEILTIQKQNFNALLKEMDSYFSNYEIPFFKVCLAGTDELNFQQDSTGGFHNNMSTKINYADINKQEGLVYFADDEKHLSSGENKDLKPDNRPNADQLNTVKEYMVEMIPKFFSKHGYTHYSSDVVFENNWATKPYIKKGLTAYTFEIMKIRWKVNWGYVSAFMEVKGAYVQESEGTVCIHWAFKGLPQSLKLLRFPGKLQSTMDSNKHITEGLSTFYLNGKGKIYKHRMDKVVQDPYIEVEKKPSLAEKIALGGNPA